jgi:hypothetical protein
VPNLGDCHAFGGVAGETGGPKSTPELGLLSTVLSITIQLRHIMPSGLQPLLHRVCGHLFISFSPSFSPVRTLAMIFEPCLRFAPRNC